MWKLSSSLILLFSVSVFGQLIRPNNLFMPLNTAASGGTVTFDSQNSTSTPNFVASITFPLTNSASADRYITVGVSLSDVGTVTCTNVTYAGVALTKFASVRPNNTANEGSIYLWGLVNPASGSNNVVVSLSASSSAGLEAGAISFTGVNQSTPTSNITTNFGVGTITTITLGSAVNNLTVAVIGSGTGPIGAAGSGVTQKWVQNNDNNSAAGNAAGGYSSGAASVTMTWTIPSDDWGCVAVSLNHD